MFLLFTTGDLLECDQQCVSKNFCKKPISRIFSPAATLQLDWDGVISFVSFLPISFCFNSDCQEGQQKATAAKCSQKPLNREDLEEVTVR